METSSAAKKDERSLSGESPQPRREELQARVNEVAKAIFAQGIRPTVTRVRAALGGGSPNDLAPAVKYWRETVLPSLPSLRGEGAATAALPFQLADLVHELWQRAVAAAVVEVRGGPTAREVMARTAEAQGLRQQVSALRDRLQRESLAYGELRAQAARHEAIGREALARAHEGDARERELLREVGSLRQRVAELEAIGKRELVARRSGSSPSRKGGVRKARGNPAAQRPARRMAEPKRRRSGRKRSRRSLATRGGKGRRR